MSTASPKLFDILKRFKESHNRLDNKINSLFGSTDFLITKLKVPSHILNDSQRPKYVKTKLKDHFQSTWQQSLADSANNNTGKLRTYALFKTYFKREKYLSVVKRSDVRKCYTSFRISSHKLEIEGPI